MSQVYRALVRIEKKEQELSYESNDSWGTRYQSNRYHDLVVLKTKKQGDAKPEYWLKPADTFVQCQQAAQLTALVESCAWQGILTGFQGEIEVSMDFMEVIDWTGGSSFEIPSDVLERIKNEADTNPEWSAQAGTPVLLEWTSQGSFNRGEMPAVILPGQRQHTYSFSPSSYAYGVEKKAAKPVKSLEWTTSVPSASPAAQSAQPQSGFSNTPFAALLKK